MSEIFERAKEHFAKIERYSIDVPEWGATIYWKPWTGAEKQKLSNAIKKTEREQELLPRAIIMKAEDEAGKPCFDIAHLQAFMSSIDPAVYERVGTEITKTGAYIPPEAAEKN